MSPPIPPPEKQICFNIPFQNQRDFKRAIMWRQLWVIYIPWLEPLVFLGVDKYSSGHVLYLVTNVPGIVFATAVPNPDNAPHKFTLIAKGNATNNNIEMAKVRSPKR